MGQEFGGSGAEVSDFKVTHRGSPLVLFGGQIPHSSLFGPFYGLLEHPYDMTSSFPKNECSRKV